jgi:ribosomal protein L7/L12
MEAGDWSSIPPGVRRTIGDLLGRGRKIEAIKLYRQSTGAGLRESKEAVEHWGETPRGNGPHGFTARPPAAAGSAYRDLPAEARAEIERLIPQGNYIGAIKTFRRHSQASLKEAMDAVYATSRGMGIEPPQRLSSPLSCTIAVLGFLAWLGLVAAMPFVARTALTRVFGEGVSPGLVEAAQVLLPVVVVIASVSLLVVRHSGKSRSTRGPRENQG